MGSLFVQPQLGQTLRLLVEAEGKTPGSRRDGLRAARTVFYEGEIARRVVAFSERVGGFLQPGDLARYRARFETPIHTTFAGCTIHTQSTWTQAAVLLQALNMLEHVDLPALGHNSPAYVHTLTEVLKLAFADRERYYGDPSVRRCAARRSARQGLRRTTHDRRWCAGLPGTARVWDATRSVEAHRPARRRQQQPAVRPPRTKARPIWR